MMTLMVEETRILFEMDGRRIWMEIYCFFTTTLLFGMEDRCKYLIWMMRWCYHVKLKLPIGEIICSSKLIRDRMEHTIRPYAPLPLVWWWCGCWDDYDDRWWQTFLTLPFAESEADGTQLHSFGSEGASVAVRYPRILSLSTYSVNLVNCTWIWNHYRGFRVWNLMQGRQCNAQGFSQVRRPIC